MKISVPKIIEKGWDRYEDDKIVYDKLITQSIALQNNLSEPEVRTQFAIFLGRHVVKTFKQAIRSQALYGEKFVNMYPPLSSQYKNSKSTSVYGKAKKRSLNAREKLYIDSKWLYDHIKYWVHHDHVFVGFREGQKHPKGPKAQDLLSWLDKGTRKQQARPLISLIVEDIVFDLEKYVDLYLEAVREKVERNTQ